MFLEINQMLFGKWEQKHCPASQISLRMEGKKSLPPSLLGFLSMKRVCVSVHRRQECDVSSSDLTCCHGNADRDILWRCSLKKKKIKAVRITLLYYILFHLGLILLKGFKGLFSSANQGIVPYSLRCQDPINVKLSFLCGQGRSMALGDHLLLSLLACTWLHNPSIEPVVMLSIFCASNSLLSRIWEWAGEGPFWACRDQS